MKIKILLPYKSILDTECLKITAPGQGGSFQLLPRHVDITWTLEPGIIEVFYKDHVDYFAVDHGVLVKKSDQVFISVFRGIKGNSFILFLLVLALLLPFSSIQISPYYYYLFTHFL